MSAPPQRVSNPPTATIDTIRASVSLRQNLAPDLSHRHQKTTHRAVNPPLPSGDVLGNPVGVNESKLNAKDVDPKDYQEVAVMALANEFFKANDISLEIRTYLLENVIPTMTMALEKLLREVDARDMIHPDDFIDAISEKAEVGQNDEKEHATNEKWARTKEEDGLDCPTDVLEIQIDRPGKVAFNPINWLAQYLYRNNPRYVDATDISNVPYFQQLRLVSQQTKARLFEHQFSQRATLRAEAMARKREKERAKKAQTQQMEEMRNLFEQLLSTVFKKWTGKLWRLVDASISKTEMIDAYKTILQSNTIQSSDNMIQKVSDLIKYLSMSPEVAETLQSQHQTDSDPPPDTTTSASPTPNQPPKYFSLAPLQLALTHFHLPNFLTTTTTITHTFAWSIDDLSHFLLALAAHIDTLAESLASIFQKIYHAPTFPTPTGPGAIFAPREEWKHRVGKMVQDLPDTPTSEGIKHSLMEWCRGNVTLSQLGVATGDTGGIRRTSMAVRGDEEMEGVGRLGGGRASISVQMSMDEREDAWVRGCGEAEGEYKKFMMVMTGLYGVDAASHVFEFLKRKQQEKEEAEAEALKKARLEKEREVSSEEMQSRLMKLQSLFLLLDDSKPFTADILNSSVDIVVAQQQQRPGGIKLLTPCVSDILNHLKYKGIKRDLEKIPITPESLTSRLADHLQISTQEFNNFSAVLELVFDAASKNTTPTPLDSTKQPQHPTPTPLPATMNRTEIQSRALTEITSLAQRNDLSIAEFSESSLHILSRAIEQLHPAHRISSRLSLTESAVTKSPTSPDLLIERFLRIVACTADTKSSLLGEMLGTGEQGYEAKVMLGAPFQEANAHEDPISPIKLSDSDRVARYVGVPLVGGGGNPVGVLGMRLIGMEDGGYVPADVSFLETGATKIISGIEHIDSREKSVQIALASVQYMREKIGDTTDISIYITHPTLPPPTPTTDIIFKVTDRPYSAIVKDPRVMSAQSREASQRDADLQNAMGFARYMAGSSGNSNVEKVAEDAPELPNITQSIKTKETIHSTPTPSENGCVKTYIPVQDEDGKVFAVVCLQNKNGATGKVSDEDLAEIKKINSVLSNCGTAAKREKFGDESVMQHLEGESIDEESRRGLLFPKMMLIAARSWISKLDNKAISELKSYKKPPPAVMKVLKAVLYLFGKKPKEVSKWQDILKYVNADLLKAMVAYDPTAMQKKIRFRRCNKVLHSLSKTDVKKKTSIPTMIMFDWLIVSIDLRKRAVEARKRHPLVFNEQASEADATESDVDGDGEEEEGVAGGQEIVEGAEEGEAMPSAALE
ncbi:EF-hand calcium-binding domain-containing protein 5 [Podochytrium sp. JEL0797]|nr:EF-hand calcium-binding domain-containing protein 5 [Podochytrium sp. JEL0797]